MNGIIYYSNTNQSKCVAEYFERQLKWQLYDLNKLEQAEKASNIVFEKVVLIFPVYCQNIPDIISEFLRKLTAQYLTVVATYGKMCYGRVLYEIQQNYKNGKIIAGAYVPMKHSYLQEKTNNDFGALSPLVKKTQENNPDPIELKKTYKNVFADFAKNTRSRMTVKITFDKEKCIYCNKCERECLFNGIKNHKTNKNCIRCLKCVTNCPSKALGFKNSLALRIYLKKKPNDTYKVFI